MPSKSATNNPAIHPAFQHVSAFEDRYGQFFESTIAAAALAHSGADRLMDDLNRIHQIVSGLGVALRIVAGNSVLESNYSGPDSQAPLSKTAEGMLTVMAAAICEKLRDDIESRAGTFNAQVSA